ncbi:MAG TPA: hypothetical protein VNL14_02315 [Candidatus Acidoferrales bacterium]|nr:hypothetical protein [Candidatus Acidoferrales bacterium]
MTIPNPHPRIFVPGKIIQVRDADDPFVLRKLVFISVEEHVRHVVEMLQWLFPDVTEEQRAGAALHDVRKKIGAHHDFFRACGRRSAPREEHLRTDFYAEDGNPISLSPSDACRGFLNFVQNSGRRRLWPVRDDAGPLSEVRLDLDPPFGNHAAEVTEADLHPYRDGSFVLADNPQRCDYVLNLVRLHHSFQPDRIVEACARHGENMVRDLYRLIVADHAGSRWAEYVVQQVEAGAEKPEGVDFFGDAEIKVTTEPVVHEPDHELKVGVVRLQRSRLPMENGNLPKVELLVRYFSLTVDWDLRTLRDFATRPVKAHPQETRKRGRGGRRATA